VTKRDTKKDARLGATGVSPVHGQDARATLKSPCKGFSIPLSNENGAKFGFTLIEVLLALALAALLLAALTMAIELHLHVADAGRTRVEEAQLARALLNRIADDLRCAVRYDPEDVEKLLPDTDILGGSADALAEEAGLDADELDELDADRTGDLDSSIVPPSVPGLFGNRYELQVDVSHLPRLDQFESMLAPAVGSRLTDRLSDVKTVAYYVVAPTDTAYAPVDAENRSGLVRRELDRAVTSWADQQGRLMDMELDLEPIAPEVSAIEFRYFDGGQWLDEWDSIDRGGLPVAVEIAIAILPPHHTDTWFSSWPTSDRQSDAESVQPVVYRLLVRLPAAEPTDEDAESQEEGESEEEKDSTEADNLGSLQGPSSGEEPKR